VFAWQICIQIWWIWNTKFESDKTDFSWLHRIPNPNIHLTNFWTYGAPALTFFVDHDYIWHERLDIIYMLYSTKSYLDQYTLSSCGVNPQIWPHLDSRGSHTHLFINRGQIWHARIKSHLNLCIMSLLRCKRSHTKFDCSSNSTFRGGPSSGAQTNASVHLQTGPGCTAIIMPDFMANGQSGK